MYMKLLFSFVFLFISFKTLEAKKVEENYIVKTKGKLEKAVNVRGYETIKKS